MMKKEDLKTHNGKEGKPVYLSYKNRIYDVSESRHWKGGVHMARHNAGEDLTDFLALAPHGEEVLSRFKEVDTLEESDTDKSAEKKMALSALYRKFHPHPMLIHFPIALFVFAMVLQTLFFITGSRSFEQSSYYSLSFATLMILPSIFSGIVSWWINYDMTATKLFKNKIIFSIILLLMGTAEVIMRSLYIEISPGDSQLFLFYNILLYANVPVTGFIAYNGGKITFPS
jgi:predicted heme/steroid binding protein